MIDIGVNLTNKSFWNDRSEILKRAKDKGVSGIVITGTSLNCSRAAFEMASSMPDYLCSTAGIHPHDASTYSETVRQELQKLHGKQEVVAVGECGLDYNRDFSPRPKQRECFAAQVELAAKSGLPLFMHQRDAHEDFINILKPSLKQVSRGVVHCFTGTETELEDYLEMDLYIGITGWICDERRGFHLKEFIGKIPNDRIMIETDAPYLTPRNLRPKPKRGRNEPSFLGHIAAEIAPLFSMTAEEFGKLTSKNAENFFNITRKAL